MGTTLPDSKENVNGAKNGVTRRNILRTGLGAALMGILGSQTVLAQDNAVAVVTKPQNVPGRTLETVAPQSGFAQAIAGLQTEIAALQDEFKKGNIDSKKMEELLTKLLLNEKVITTEVQKALTTILDRLKRTYQMLPESDKKKAKIKEIGLRISDLNSNIGEGNNLIIAIYEIDSLLNDPEFQKETAGISRQYIRNISNYVHDTSMNLIQSINSYEKSFTAKPSDEIVSFTKTLTSFTKNNPGDEKKVEVSQKGNLVKNGNFKSRNNQIDDWSFSDTKNAEVDTKKGQSTFKLKENGGYFYVKQNVRLAPGKYNIALPVIQENANGASLLEVKINDKKIRIPRKDKEFLGEITVEKGQEIEIYVYVSRSEVSKDQMQKVLEVTYGTLTLLGAN